MYVPSTFIVLKDSNLESNSDIHIVQVTEDKNTQTTSKVRRGAIYKNQNLISHDKKLKDDSLVMYKCEEEDATYQFLCVTVDDIQTACTSHKIQSI